MNIQSFLSVSIVSRYSEIYLNEKTDEINTFDPLTLLYEFKDYFRNNEGYFNICNREPFCDCKDVNNCLCDDDEYMNIQSINLDIVSNCKCNFDIILKEQKRKYKLEKDFLWNIFFMKNGREKNVVDIYPFESQIIFKNSKDGHVVFKTEDEIKQNKDGNMYLQFNYMSFELRK